MIIPTDKHFYFQDGSSAGSLKDLKEKMETISYEEFYNFVNEEKNDFANWVQYVVNNQQLADKLRKVTSIVETVEILNEELNPKETKEHMGKLADQDFQKLIEDALFGDLEEPAKANESLPEEAQELSLKSEAVEQVEDAEDDNKVTAEDLQKMSKIEKPSEKKEGDLKLEKKDTHIPITKKPEATVTKKEQELNKLHHAFLVKETLWGFLLGLIIGLILGRVISIFI